MSDHIAREQELSSRLFGAKEVADVSLDTLAALYGDEAEVKFEAMREQLLDKFKNSDITAEREMEHATIVGPALEIIDHIIDEAIQRLNEKY